MQVKCPGSNLALPEQCVGEARQNYMAYVILLITDGVKSDHFVSVVVHMDAAHSLVRSR